MSNEKDPLRQQPDVLDDTIAKSISEHAEAHRRSVEALLSHVRRLVELDAMIEHVEDRIRELNHLGYMHPSMGYKAQLYETERAAVMTRIAAWGKERFK